MKFIFCNLPLHARSPIIVIFIVTSFNYNIDFPNRSLLFTFSTAYLKDHNLSFKSFYTFNIFLLQSARTLNLVVTKVFRTYVF